LRALAVLGFSVCLLVFVVLVCRIASRVISAKPGPASVDFSLWAQRALKLLIFIAVYILEVVPVALPAEPVTAI
jgi:cytochrome b561